MTTTAERPLTRVAVNAGCALNALRPLPAAARRRLASAAFGGKPRLQNWIYEYAALIAAPIAFRPASIPASARPVGRPRVGVRGAKSIAEAAHGGPALRGRRIAAVGDAAQVVRAPRAGIGGGARQCRRGQRQHDNGDRSHGFVLGKQTGDSVRLEREGVQHQGAGDDRAQGQSEYLGNPTFAHFNLPTQTLAML